MWGIIWSRGEPKKSWGFWFSCDLISCCLLQETKGHMYRHALTTVEKNSPLPTPHLVLYQTPHSFPSFGNTCWGEVLNSCSHTLVLLGKNWVWNLNKQFTLCKINSSTFQSCANSHFLFTSTASCQYQFYAWCMCKVFSFDCYFTFAQRRNPQRLDGMNVDMLLENKAKQNLFIKRLGS